MLLFRENRTTKWTVLQLVWPLSQNKGWSDEPAGPRFQSFAFFQGLNESVLTSSKTQPCLFPKNVARFHVGGFFHKTSNVVQQSNKGFALSQDVLRFMNVLWAFSFPYSHLYAPIWLLVSLLSCWIPASCIGNEPRGAVLTLLAAWFKLFERAGDAVCAPPVCLFSLRLSVLTDSGRDPSGDPRGSRSPPLLLLIFVRLRCRFRFPL